MDNAYMAHHTAEKPLEDTELASPDIATSAYSTAERF